MLYLQIPRPPQEPPAEPIPGKPPIEPPEPPEEIPPGEPDEIPPYREPPPDERVQTVHRLTFDLREEPGALAAHARICAGCALESA